MTTGDRVRYIGDWWPKLTGSYGTIERVCDGAEWIAVLFDSGERVYDRPESMVLWSPLHQLAEVADG